MVCGGVDYSSVETEDACLCCGPARNSRSGPHLPGERGEVLLGRGAIVWSPVERRGGEVHRLTCRLHEKGGKWAYTRGRLGR